MCRIHELLLGIGYNALSKLGPQNQEYVCPIGFGLINSQWPMIGQDDRSGISRLLGEERWKGGPP